MIVLKWNVFVDSNLVSDFTEVCLNTVSIKQAVIGFSVA